YTWGDASSTFGIKINGDEVKIQSNLWSLLQHARVDVDAPGTLMPATQELIDLERELRYHSPKHDTLGYFWVDALCIDQNNTVEKNSQVAKMKDIYERSTKIVVWLGYEDDDSNLAMDTIEQLGTVAMERGEN